MDAKTYYRMIHAYLRRAMNAGARGYLDNSPTGVRIDVYRAAQQAIKATGRHAAETYNHRLFYQSAYHAA